MKQIVLDTNVLLRFLLNDIPHQADEAEKKFKKAKESRSHLVVPQIVIFEIVFSLVNSYGFDKSRVIEVVKRLLGSDYLLIQDKETFNLAAEIYLKNKVSFADCFVISYAKIMDAEVFSFDKDLNKLI